MMDLLINAGAQPGGVLGALAQGNVSAAAYLIDRGDHLTLAAAVGLERMDDVRRLSATAGKEERLTALTVASFYGKPHLISLLLALETDPNGYPGKDSGFHWHATPLHQAVSSGSLDAVKLLVAAGAKLDAMDRRYEGTALGWAQHMRNENGKYQLIEKYLLGLMP
jgi:ankyrin repeat protein